MTPLREEIVQDLADLALRDPVGLFWAIGPDPRRLDATWMRAAGDSLEKAARKLQAGKIDLWSFGRVVDDVARSAQFSTGTVAALRDNTRLPGSRRQNVSPARRSPRRRGSAEEIRAALRCGRPHCACHRLRARVHCPAHPDEYPDLSVNERDGRVLVHCFAGCTQEAVLRALSARGLWGTP